MLIDAYYDGYCAYFVKEYMSPYFGKHHKQWEEGWFRAYLERYVPDDSPVFIGGG